MDSTTTENNQPENLNTENAENISKFEYIINSISSKYNKKELLLPSFKYNKNDHTLLIKLIYKKGNIDYNPTKTDIHFLLKLDDKYPDTPPTLTCLTNFCFPTIFDNRNLLYSIITHYWINNQGTPKNFPQCLIDPIEEIIKIIPQFISRLMENTNHKILVYYGDYRIDMVYNMNDFLVNNEIEFYKTLQFLKTVNKKGERHFKERYVILTDIYFLLFDPVPSSKNLGKLLFWGDIRQIISTKPVFNSNSYESMILEWRNDDKLIQFDISFVNSTQQEFLERATRKILRLREQYKIFQDDISKPAENDEIISKVKDINLSNSAVDKLVLLIKYKEELLEKQNSANMIKELMSLYQKVIEIYSAKGDMEFKVYLEKLHSMLDNKNNREELEKDNNSNSLNGSNMTNVANSNKDVFELSHSYHEDHEECDIDM